MTDDVVISLVPYDSELYRESLALRDAVLRVPLGLDFSVQDVESEQLQLHIVALRDRHMVGCVVLKPLDGMTVQLRQMAVTPEMQGNGIGAALVRFAETTAREISYAEIILHARMTALGFYLRLGYESYGDQHIAVTIPHIWMRKSL